ncbi:hypothetical protein MJO28_000641 [Puccinia striiformis f. sp. tritici]|uniref:Uncharacterized protein n=1 Tax=Puccinia striiformis f. sp. tritici TaxID=168172 RepID=A0ACC0EYU0_9BASI|nr:hypothetical protein Pst134EB_001810 [Puccinia striiformis f. sp. tritici]KAI7962547.1 hypothetical protein MJO28_000641 [Puccinia striiformis f. sp. tritici]
MKQNFVDHMLAEFDRLLIKYEPLFIGEGADDHYAFERAFSALSVDQVRKKEGLVGQMRGFLPLLDEQFKALSGLLIPSDVWKRRERTRKVILQAQSELEHTIDQMRFIVTAVCPPTSEPLSAREQTDDQHLKGLKSYRLHRLKYKFDNEVLFFVNLIFNRGLELFRQIKSAPAHVKPDKFNRCSCRVDLTDDVRRASTMIESTIRFLELSELDLAQDHWNSELLGIDEKMMGIMAKVRESANEPVKQIAQRSIPIIKLIKIFYYKLSKRGINSKGFPRYTNMNSEHIKSVAESINAAHKDIAELLLLLRRADTGFGAATSHEFLHLANTLKSRLEPPLFLVPLYLIPLIPVTDGLELRTYYINWVDTWSTQFYLAIHNFKRLAKKFDRAHF